MTTPTSTVELGSWGVEGAIRELAHAPTAAEFWKTAVHRWEPLLVRELAARFSVADSGVAPTVWSHRGVVVSSGPADLL